MMLTTNRCQFLLFFSIHCNLLEATQASGIYQNLDLFAEQFSDTTSHRQNFCEENAKFNRDEVELNLALKGRDINIALGVDPAYVHLNPDGEIDPIDPGLMIVLLDEVAVRGEFSWRKSFTLEYPPIKGKSWDELLMWSVENYDVSANWWYFTPARSAKGVSFPRGWYDANMIIIAKKDEDSYFNGSKFSLFSWSAPFTIGVWLSLAGTMAISGIVCYFLEERNGSGREAARSTFSVISTYVHASFIVFTGHLDLLPTTAPGQLVSFSLSFFAMLMLSMYTANLASFLVIQQGAFKTNIETVNDIVKSGRSMCIYGSGSAAQESIEKTYKSALIVEKVGDLETLLGLQDDECDYAIVGKSGWSQYERTEETNGDCNLARVGRVYKEYEAGFATKSDAGTLCTSLVRDVLNSIFYEMHEDGSIEKMWEDHLTKNQNIVTPCSDSITSVLNENSAIISMNTLGGVFILHFVLCALALLMAWWIASCKRSDENSEQVLRKYAAARGRKFFTNSVSWKGDQILNINSSSQIIDDSSSETKDQLDHDQHINNVENGDSDQYDAHGRQHLSNLIEEKFSQARDEMISGVQEQMEGKFTELEEQIVQIASILKEMRVESLTKDDEK